MTGVSPGSLPGPACAWEPVVENELQVLEASLARAHRGDGQVIEVLLQMATGEYIRTAEGGEYLNEVYLDLLIKQPKALGRVLATQSPAVQAAVIAELSRPVTDK